MITKNQLSDLLSISTIYSSFAQIYSTLEELDLNILPEELKEDSKILYEDIEKLLEKYNNYICNEIENSGLSSS